MTILPAIDLLNEECVRLFKGDYDQKTVYGKDPVAVAKGFEDGGARRIHIVDLNAARSGGRENRDIIRKIKESVNCTIEVGGGIRGEADIEELLDIGIDRLILGTVLVKKQDEVAGWVKKYGQVFVGGIDALNGEVKVAGWEAGSNLSDIDLAKKAKDMGIISIIYTNIAKDGTLQGPDLERTNIIAEKSGLPVILSGGISCNDDFKDVVENGHPGIKGIITGKAIYEGKIDVFEVIKNFQSKETEGVVW